MVSYFGVIFLYIRMKHHLVMSQINTEGIVWQSLNGL